MTAEDQPETIPLEDLAEAMRTLDLGAVTLGDMHRLEVESGLSFDELLSTGRTTRRLVALWLWERKRSRTPRSWRDLSSLRMPVVPRSTSPDVPAGHQTSSNG